MIKIGRYKNKLNFIKILIKVYHNVKLKNQSQTFVALNFYKNKMMK